MDGNRTSGFAIAALILGIFSIFIPILGIVAIILGVVAITKISKDPTTSGKGLAIAGIVLGFISIVIGVIVLTTVNSWGRSYADDISKKVIGSDAVLNCRMDIKMEILKIDDKPQICYGGSGDEEYIEFTIQNTGRLDIEAISVTTKGKKMGKIYGMFDETSIVAGNSLLQNIKYSYTDQGDISFVEIMPAVKSGNKIVSCFDASLDIIGEDIQQC